MRTLNKKLNAEEIFNLQKYQYSEKIVLEDSVPAASSKMCKVGISNIGHFLCQTITGKYISLKVGGAGAGIDTGISYLKGLLYDGAGQRKLFNDFIPFDLWLSPGRVRNSTATNTFQPDGAIVTASPSNNLFYPIDFEYIFQANSDILLDVKNSSDKAIDFSIVFHGVRINSAFAVSGL